MSDSMYSCFICENLHTSPQIWQCSFLQIISYYSTILTTVGTRQETAMSYSTKGCEVVRLMDTVYVSTTALMSYEHGNASNTFIRSQWYTQCNWWLRLVSNTECKQRLCLFTRKFHIHCTQLITQLIKIASFPHIFSSKLC